MHSKKYFVLTVQLTILQADKSQDDFHKKNLNISSSENTIKSLVQFYKPTNPSENAQGYILADIYLLFQSESLFIKLRKQDINQEIHWDQKTLDRIEHQFGNTKTHRISFEYDISENLLNCYIAMQQHLSYQSAYTSQIKVLLFSKKPINLYTNSFEQMKLLFLRVQQQKQHTYQQKVQEQLQILQTIEQIGNIQSQIQLLHKNQIEDIKKKFVEDVNQVKEANRLKFGRVLYLDVAENNMSANVSIPRNFAAKKFENGAQEQNGDKRSNISEEQKNKSFEDYFNDQ